ncbi:MAG: sugar nucleotide-binding protein [Acidimicrobiia bacterium]|nr:sugar nucleotide-binding protein [Acidimicrobiia bacterium]MYG59486.1 sugar nucleotide-binding protein [Acidimicrobiia bacterium]MYJ31570.1 sugar nucleotide-binding protein [Acidimicrobiia bacterium]
MRAYVTGGTGFLGSNIVKVFAERHRATVHCPVHSFVPDNPQGYTTEPLDLLEADAVLASVAQFEPDVIVHSMILNDLAGIYAQRELAWRSYVDATLTLAEAANRAGAKLILVSTDWVFDGTQTGADEHTPPNPVNYYGVLKALSEQAALLRADRAAVARVSAVNGVHWARDYMPRGQDPGFGYFVTTVLDAVSQDEPFGVWESDDINMKATPSLASECAEAMWLMAANDDADGIFHCCGAQPAGRMELAQLACEVFGHDPSLLRSVPPDQEMMALLGGARVPRDTTMRTPRTTEILGYVPLGTRELLERFKQEIDTGDLVPTGLGG